MTSEESRYADIQIARGAQRKHLAKETEILQTEAAKTGRTDGEIESILPNGSTLRYLPVYFDLGENVIRLRSRLHRASALAHDLTNHIIIPKGLAAKRLVLDAHQRWMHASQKTVFNSLHQKYWFIGGFMYLKNLVRKLCKKTVVGTSDTCCLLYTSPSPRDRQKSRMPSSA